MSFQAQGQGSQQVNPSNLYFIVKAVTGTNVTDLWTNFIMDSPVPHDEAETTEFKVVNDLQVCAQDVPTAG